jgi:ABC-type lipoprotein release transport system permease subunit
VLVFRMAWRNAWRNLRRTGIVVVAVSVGIAGTILAMAFNYGFVIQMVETAIETELGHVQVHAPGFDENPELRVRLEDGGAAVLAALEAAEGVRAFARRIQAEGLIASPRASVGVRILGVEPEFESEVTVVARSVTAGSYLDAARGRVLIGEKLATRLSVGVGDKVVLSAQDLSGELTGEALRVVGLFHTASRALDEGAVFLVLSDSQRLLGMGEAVSGVVAVASSRGRIDGLRDALVASLGEVEVQTWEDLQPALVYIVEVFDQVAVLIYVAIFIAMAFGIANVLLMTVYERVREIGILTAIGFGQVRLVLTIVVEAIVVTLMGVVVGIAIALASMWLLRDGIDISVFAGGLDAYGIGSRITPVLRSGEITTPVWVAVVTAVLAAAWPARRAVSLLPAQAVRESG